MISTNTVEQWERIADRLDLVSHRAATTLERERNRQDFRTILELTEDKQLTDTVTIFFRDCRSELGERCWFPRQK